MSWFNKISLISMPVVFMLSGCGSGSGSDSGYDPGTFFGPQDFKDTFDSGKPDSRWGCGQGGCLWQVEETPGSITPGGNTTQLKTGFSNYVLQSPDPQASDLNVQLHCESFSAHFAQSGTFAFDYFVNTAGPLGVQDGNVLKVSIGTSTVDTNSGTDFPVDTQWEPVLSVSGQANSRYQKSLPPGYYKFEFCYDRSRTISLTEPDFVQVDNVETCVGTGCATDTTAQATKCIVDQGETLVPQLDAIPEPLFAFTGSGADGISSPYVLIINTDLLEFLQYADPGDPVLASLRNEIDAVSNQTLVDAQTCDSDTRKFVRIEMTEAEALDFAVANFEVNQYVIYVYLAIKMGWTTEKTQEMVSAFIGQVTPWKVKLVGHISNIVL